MEDRQYQGLVRALEREASTSPALFRLKVYALTAFAYIVLFAFLLCIAALGYAAISAGRAHHNSYLIAKFVIFALVMLPLFWVVLRTIFVRLPPPEGIELTREKAPKLFGMLDDLQRRYNGPEVHHVLVDGEFNACISQVPRLGLFGWHRNYLVLGMPFLCAMTRAETTATVAHEYGHLVGSHGKMGAWVYRQRRTFAAVHDHLLRSDPEHWANALAIRALEWFAPYFNAYTFVLSRQDEYEADAIATEVAGAAANADGLVRATLIARWLRETFWPKFGAQAERQAQPAHLPYVALTKLVLASHAQWARKEWLAEALTEPSDLHDTHPCLRDRVEALGRQPAVPAPAADVGATALLGFAAASLVAELDKQWWADAGKGWRDRYQRVTRARSRVAALGARPVESLAAHEVHELAMMHLELNDSAAARPILEHLLDRPGGPFPRADYAFGCVLLRENDDRGLEHLRRAALAERRLANDCVNAACSFLERRQGREAAQEWFEDFSAALAA